MISSAQSIKEQVESELRLWGDDLMCDLDEDGKVWVCFLRPVSFEIGGGVFVVDELIERIATVKPGYPLSAVMRTKQRRWDPPPWQQVLARRQAIEKAIRAEVDDAEHEARAELLGAFKDRVSVSMAQ